MSPYEIRKKERLLHILDVKSTDKLDVCYKKIGIFVYLYYENDVNKYILYLNQIDEEVKIHIFSSKQSVLDRVQTYINRKNYEVILKPNRGRDISALLIAARPYIQKYQYICFIHDKSANGKHLIADTNFWIENLWENTLLNQNYINQVIKLFQKNKALGLLFPPEPYGEFLSHWYGDTWFNNFHLTKKLSQQLNLNADISTKYPIFTLGTVFWARVKCLDKLFNYPWQYENFDQEPLAIDGTLSHAIERILPYVAQDSGYYSGTIMNNNYAEKLLLIVQEDMRYMFNRSVANEHIVNLSQIKNLDNWRSRLIGYTDVYQKIYIYGAGTYGKMTAKIIQDQKFIVSGFIVSDGHKDRQSVYGIPVYELSEIEDINKKGIIVAISYENREEIHQILESRGVFHYLDGI